MGDNYNETERLRKELIETKKSLFVSEAKFDFMIDYFSRLYEEKNPNYKLFIDKTGELAFKLGYITVDLREARKEIEILRNQLKKHHINPINSDDYENPDR